MIADRETRAGLWLLCGLLFYFLPLVVLVCCYLYGIRGDELWYIVISSAFVLWIMGQWMIVRSKRLEQPTIEQAQKNDLRPPVLYLRSFQADSKDERRRWLNLIFRSKDGVHSSTEEELTELVTKIGPVIAVGRPGEKLPQLGAARVYISDDQWQESVKTYMNQCQLILLRAGKTSGLKWELREIINHIDPEKVMIYIPNRRDFPSFREWANKLLPKSLPEDWPIDTLVFTKDWEPTMPKAAWWEHYGVTIDEGKFKVNS